MKRFLRNVNLVDDTVGISYFYVVGYQLSDTTSLYCTELVWRAYLHQGIDLSDGQRHDVPLMVSGDGECIFPSDIEESEQVLYVKPLKTKQQ